MDFSNLWTIATDSPMLLFTQLKLRAFRLSAVTVSLHHLPQMSVFNSHMRAKHLLQLLTLNLWRFVAMLLLHNRDQR